MQGSIGELIGLLREEVEQYYYLLLMTRRERVRILRGEIFGIHEMVRKKDEVAGEMERFAIARSLLLDRLAEELGEEPEGFTLGRLAQLVPEEAGEVLRPLLGDFRQIVSRLMAANDVNRTLLNHSLEMVENPPALFRTLAPSTPSDEGDERVGGAIPLVSGTNQRARAASLSS